MFNFCVCRVTGVFAVWINYIQLAANDYQLVAKFVDMIRINWTDDLKDLKCLLYRKLKATHLNKVICGSIGHISIG